MTSRPKPGVVNQAGTCDSCGGPVTHRPGKPGEFDHECRPAYSIYSPLCGGCGVALQPANAWMQDGCPCNTPRGVNDGNQLISHWRLLLQQTASHNLAVAQEANERLVKELVKRDDRIAELEKQLSLVSEISNERVA